MLKSSLNDNFCRIAQWVLAFTPYGFFSPIGHHDQWPSVRFVVWYELGFMRQHEFYFEMCIVKISIRYSA